MESADSYCTTFYRKGTDYLVVYSGHRNIDSKGNIIGKYNPSIKEGNIFSSLLRQFDVPTSSLIMNLKRYKDLGVEVIFIHPMETL